VDGLNRLLNTSVTRARLVVIRIQGQDARLVLLQAVTNPAVPLDLLDSGVFLGVSQRLRADPERPGSLHLDRYEYRIGWGTAKSEWLVRYEYLENPAAEYQGQYVYANAHVHFNGSVASDFLDAIPDRHFPTRKLWLEEVLHGVCADVILPRYRQRRRDERPIFEALDRIEEQISTLSAQS
jgi:hypothetical protein